jgi:hypothetical protein
MIRKLASGEYRLYSRKKDAKTGRRRNLGTFKTRRAAEQHEREVQFLKDIESVAARPTEILMRLVHQDQSVDLFS